MGSGKIAANLRLFIRGTEPVNSVYTATYVKNLAVARKFECIA